MITFKARLAHILTRRIAIAASIVTLAGAGAGAAAVAVVHASGHAPAAGALTASTAASTPSSSASAKGRHHRTALALAVVRATARETGLSAKSIRKDLRSGQTLDHIAGGKAGAVEQDVLSALTSRLDTAVAAGKITAAQESSRVAKARTRIETLMSTPLSARHSAPNAAG